MHNPCQEIMQSSHLFIKACEKFRDSFIAVDILENHKAIDITYRYRLLTATLMVAIAVVSFFACALPVISQDLNLLLIWAICIPLIAHHSFLLMHLKKQQNIHKTVNHFVASIYTSIALGIFAAGGIYGSLTPIFLPLPAILAFLLGSRKTGFKYAVCTAIFYVLLMLLDAWGVNFPQTISEGDAKYIENILWFYYLLILFSLVILYENLTQHLFVQREHEKNTLSYIASHDDLTGLANRKYFDEKLNEALHRAERLSIQVSLLTIDLNDFKPINDEYGHHCGDVLLKHAAKAISATIRVDDVAARIGGDEFTVIVQGETQRAQLSALANRLCESISEVIVVDGHKLSVSASIGIACYPEQTRDEDHLRTASDMAMYSAKKSDEDFVFFEDLGNKKAL